MMASLPNLDVIILICGVSCITVFMVCWWFFSKREQRRRFDVSKHAYEEAVALREAGDHLMALVAAAKSVGGYCHSHPAHNLLGDLLEKLGNPAGAASEWRAARHQPGVSADWEVYYYYREARAFVEADNWEFAFLRSRDAILFVGKGDLPSVVDDIECEAQLRAIHMYAALHHLRGSEALAQARAQATWLKERAKDSSLRDLGRTLDESLHHWTGNDDRKPLAQVLPFPVRRR
jgi:hypothetical protein